MMLCFCWESRRISSTSRQIHSARNYSRFWKLCISIVGGTLSLLLVIKRIPSLGFLFILTTTDQCKLKQTKNLKWCKAMHYFKKEKERKKKDINRKMEKIYFMSNYICQKLIFRSPIFCSWWYDGVDR